MSSEDKRAKMKKDASSALKSFLQVGKMRAETLQKFTVKAGNLQKQREEAEQERQVAMVK